MSLNMGHYLHTTIRTGKGIFVNHTGWNRQITNDLGHAYLDCMYSVADVG